MLTSLPPPRILAAITHQRDIEEQCTTYHHILCSLTRFRRHYRNSARSWPLNRPLFHMACPTPPTLRWLRRWNRLFARKGPSRPPLACMMAKFSWAFPPRRSTIWAPLTASRRSAGAIWPRRWQPAGGARRRWLVQCSVPAWPVFVSLPPAELAASIVVQRRAW